MTARDFKGIWIPKHIWLSKILSLQDKVFLVEISSLDNGDRGCYASNKYFAEFFGLSEDRCSTIISSLNKKGILSIALDRKSGKTKRKIRVIHSALSPIPTRPKDRVVPGEPLGEKTAYNNTVNNTVDTVDGQKPATEWTLAEALRKMEEKENSHLDIIATFIREKPVKVENGKALTTIIKRYSKIASEMSGAFSNKQIIEAMDRVKADTARRAEKGDGVDWHLETVYKKLTK